MVVGWDQDRLQRGGEHRVLSPHLSPPPTPALWGVRVLLAAGQARHQVPLGPRHQADGEAAAQDTGADREQPQRRPGLSLCGGSGQSGQLGLLSHQSGRVSPHREWQEGNVRPRTKVVFHNLILRYQNI